MCSLFHNIITISLYNAIISVLFLFVLLLIDFFTKITIAFTITTGHIALAIKKY